MPRIKKTTETKEEPKKEETKSKEKDTILFFDYQGEYEQAIGISVTKETIDQVIKEKITDFMQSIKEDMEKEILKTVRVGTSKKDVNGKEFAYRTETIEEFKKSL